MFSFSNRLFSTLKYHIPPHLFYNIIGIAYKHANFHTSNRRKQLENKLVNIFKKSPWCHFSRPQHIVNLSNRPLTFFERIFLGFGLNFALPPNNSDTIAYLKSISRNSNFLNLMGVSGCDKHNFRLPNFLISALNSLKKDRSIVIKRADKGGAITILDSDTYFSKCTSILDDSDTYECLKSNPLPSLITRSNKILKDFIPTDLHNKIKVRSPNLSYFYGLPKLHKPDIPLRPIVSAVGSPLYKLSRWLANIISPFLGKISGSHLKHNLQFIQQLNSVTPGELKMVSFDVVSLFTKVPISDFLAFFSFLNT